MRTGGILLPVFSLPSVYGAGSFSTEARAFISRLREAGASWWQILPLTRTGWSFSPYDSISAFAGDPLYIDPEALREQGLLTEEDLLECAGACKSTGDHIDYPSVSSARERLLRKAYRRISALPAPVKETLFAGFQKFSGENAYWLRDYALFMALSEKYGAAWRKWPEELKRRDPAAIKKAHEEYLPETTYHAWVQYEFHREWEKLHAFARDNGVRILGDIPIYVSMESCDVWQSPVVFQLDEDLQPLSVSGCPPDAFSESGQLWNNPLYAWAGAEEEVLRWWTGRIAHTFRLFDAVRIDHFRGLESYYSIPAGSENALTGHWEKGPGMRFFSHIREKLGDLPFFAEDLGYITPEVRELLRETGCPGMKVLEFAFDSGEENPYLPSNFETDNSIVYTGTHDNDTLVSWFRELPDYKKDFVRWYLRTRQEESASRKAGELLAPGKALSEEEGTAAALILLVLSSRADTAVIPMQDLLLLGGEARMNVPSVPLGNWAWRLEKGLFSEDLAAGLRELNRITSRLPG